MCSLPLLLKDSSEEIQDGKKALAQHLLDNSIYCLHLAYFYFALLGIEAGDGSQGLLLGKHFIIGSVLQPLLMCSWGQVYWLVVMVRALQCNFLATTIFVSYFSLPFGVTSSSKNFKVD